MIDIVAGRKKKAQRKATNFQYIPSFDSQIPTGWRHRNTKWSILNKTMDQLLSGSHENARFDVTESDGVDSKKAITSIRGAIYRWSVKAEIDTKKYKVCTSASFTEDDVPYVVAWIEEK